MTLAYRLSGGTYDRQITKYVEDATLRSTSPGGFASVTCQLHKPLLDTDVNQFDLLTVYDAATGEIVGQGRLEDPGQSTGSDGEIWDLTAIGMGPAHTQDTTRTYTILDQSIDTFEAFTRSAAPLTADVGNIPDSSGSQGLIFTFPRGFVAVTNDEASLIYRVLSDGGQLLGAFGYRQKSGQTAAAWEMRGSTAIDDGTQGMITGTTTNTESTAANTYTAYCSTDFTTAKNQVLFRFIYTGAGGTVGGDVTWTSVNNVWVAAQRVNKSGTVLTGSGNYGSTVLASQVVEDLLGGGMLPLFDGPNSTVATTTYGIDQASWPDGVTAADVLDEMLTVESAYTWHVWGQGSNGLWPLEFVAWPTTVRYEYTVADGFDSPASSADLYDQVQVRGINFRGMTRSRLRTQTVPALTAAGVHRRAVLDLGDEVWSAANADRAGDRFLADHAITPNAGTLHVAGKVKDLQTGRMVSPAMVRPGNLIRVRGVRPSIDSLNATDRDGVTVFRIVSNEYRDSEGAADLELDAFSATQARQLARQSRRSRKK